METFVIKVSYLGCGFKNGFKHILFTREALLKDNLTFTSILLDIKNYA